MIDKEIAAKLKGEGFLLQKGAERFACRVRTLGGKISCDELAALSDIADKYAQSRVMLTQRGCVEIPGIAFEDIDAVKQALTEANLIHGGTGARVRPIVCCKGSYCSHGIIDTTALCEALDKEFFAQPTPHKFKISICGCPNNCTRIETNDLGIQPARGGIKLFIGGKSGRSLIIAKALEKVIPMDEIIPSINKILEFYRENGQPKERVGQTIERLGIDINSII